MLPCGVGGGHVTQYPASTFLPVLSSSSSLSLSLFLALSLVALSLSLAPPLALPPSLPLAIFSHLQWPSIQWLFKPAILRSCFMHWSSSAGLHIYGSVISHSTSPCHVILFLTTFLFTFYIFNRTKSIIIDLKSQHHSSINNFLFYQNYTFYITND